MFKKPLRSSEPPPPPPLRTGRFNIRLHLTTVEHFNSYGHTGVTDEEKKIFSISVANEPTCHEFYFETETKGWFTRSDFRIRLFFS